jgi:ComF family protein
LTGFLNILNDFLSLFFPFTCDACNDRLLNNESLICARCLYNLPKTNYHLEKNNPVAQIFWGRVEIENATALYFYNKGSKFQKLIHKLKYNGKKEIGFELGKYFASILISSEFYKKFDIIIPVPLHPKREKKRGYNQSYWFALGLNEIYKAEVNSSILYRAVETETQTKKTRFERWKNVDSIFQTRDRLSLQNKHILLVDDVLTTGATLEACAAKLKETENTRVSIATLAVAD